MCSIQNEQKLQIYQGCQWDAPIEDSDWVNETYRERLDQVDSVTWTHAEKVWLEGVLH